MASNDQKHVPNAVPPENEATMPATTEAVSTPRESHERPSSSTSHSTDNIDAEKQDQPTDEMVPAQQMQSKAESIYPPQREVLIVMLALFLAMFLVAIDRTM